MKSLDIDIFWTQLGHYFCGYEKKCKIHSINIPRKDSSKLDLELVDLSQRSPMALATNSVIRSDTICIILIIGIIRASIHTNHGKLTINVYEMKLLAGSWVIQPPSRAPEMTEKFSSLRSVNGKNPENRSSRSSNGKDCGHPIFRSNGFNLKTTKGNVKLTLIFAPLPSEQRNQASSLGSAKVSSVGTQARMVLLLAFYKITISLIGMTLLEM